jgi:non-specific serine/threonine protein kinase/serine/threonine-protein kinase
MSELSSLESIFFAVLDKAPAERTAFLVEACGGDDSLRHRVEKMLSAQAEAASFLEVPAAAVAIDAGLTANQAPAERLGTCVGPYKLLQVIGEGGMGVVYMAEQKEPVERRVALKIIKPGMDTRQVIARFEAERQALAMMDHPNIAKVLDAGTIGEGTRDSGLGTRDRPASRLPLAPSPQPLAPVGRPYFVMELVKGAPITQFCDEQRLTLNERLELFVPVCQAVQHAHQKGVIHRDLKPTNILVALYDGAPVPKIIDFGVAKATAHKLTEKTMFTGWGQLIGTLEYMSPEQAQLNQLDIDTRSDIYSLGVLLYELLTGSTPFGQTRLRTIAFDETLRIIREEEPQRPSTRLHSSGFASRKRFAERSAPATSNLASIAADRSTEPDRLTRLVRGELDWIVMKALEKDRSRRYETANGLAMDLRRYLNNEPVVACPPSRAYLIQKFVQRNRGPVLSACLLLIVLVGGIIGTTWGMIWAEKAREVAVAAQLAEQTRAEGERRAKEEAQKRLAQIEQGTETLAALIRDVDPMVAEKEGVTLRVLLGRRLGEAAQQLEGDAVGDPLVVARLQHVLGISLHELGQFQQAELVLVKACRTRERLLGAGNLDTIATKHHLAMLYRAQGKYALAEPLLHEVVKIRTTRLGTDCPDTLHSQQQLAMLYHSQLKFALAEKLCQEVLDLRTARLGADHLDTLTSQHRLAMIYRSQGKFNLAESLCQEVLERRTAKLGADNLDTLASKQLLAALCCAQGKNAQAETLYKEVLDRRTAKLGHDHPDTLGTQHHLTTLYRSMKRFDLSIPLLEETLKLSTEKLGPDHRSTVLMQADLAASYYDVGRFADATALLGDLEEIEGREAQVPTDADAALTRALQRLVHLYEASAQTGSAAKWRKRLEERATRSEK